MLGLKLNHVSKRGPWYHFHYMWQLPSHGERCMFKVWYCFFIYPRFMWTVRWYISPSWKQFVLWVSVHSVTLTQSGLNKMVDLFAGGILKSLSSLGHNVLSLEVPWVLTRGEGVTLLVMWTLLGVCQGSLFESRFLSQGCIFGKNSSAKGIFLTKNPKKWHFGTKVASVYGNFS